jgi:hypothetical protein
MSDWRIAHDGVDETDDIQIKGLKVWKHTWRPSDPAAVRLPLPNRPEQSRNFPVYEIGDPSNPVVFAAAEVSNGVYCFYERVEDATS